MPESNSANKSKKWKFEDYAFVITGILVVFLIFAPEILYTQFGISILGGGFDTISPEFLEGLDDGYRINRWSINELRSLSPMLFLLTTTICMFKDAIDARKSGGYKGSVFTHTFKSLFEDAIYMAITTIMVYGAVFFDAMYASWLAGPITWILFVFIFPFIRKKSDSSDEDGMPWLLLLIFLVGIITEAITGVWIAFPLSWLIICTSKLVDILREKIFSTDTVFDVLYYAFSVALLAVGMSFDFWMMSWIPFPIALLICWIMSKFRRFKKVEANER